MIQIEKTILSIDIFEKNFCCDISKCKGVCCVEGDAGAPLTENETKILEEIFPIIKKYMTEESLKEISHKGFYVIDEDGDKVTPLINNAECVYYFRENGITKCAIEKAFLNNEINFKKPISCHLYPIRITEYEAFDAINYDQQYFCKSAREKGNRISLPLYKYLKEPLVRKYGKLWYEQVEIAAEEYLKKNYNK